MSRERTLSPNPLTGKGYSDRKKGIRTDIKKNSQTDRELKSHS